MPKAVNIWPKSMWSWPPNLSFLTFDPETNDLFLPPTNIKQKKTKFCKDHETICPYTIYFGLKRGMVTTWKHRRYQYDFCWNTKVVYGCHGQFRIKNVYLAPTKRSNVAICSAIAVKSNSFDKTTIASVDETWFLRLAPTVAYRPGIFLSGIHWHNLLVLQVQFFCFEHIWLTAVIIRKEAGGNRTSQMKKNICQASKNVTWPGQTRTDLPHRLPFLVESTVLLFNCSSRRLLKFSQRVGTFPSCFVYITHHPHIYII